MKPAQLKTPVAKLPNEKRFLRRLNAFPRSFCGLLRLNKENENHVVMRGFSGGSPEQSMAETIGVHGKTAQQSTCRRNDEGNRYQDPKNSR
jgi:hypothetical protein